MQNIQKRQRPLKKGARAWVRLTKIEFEMLGLDLEFLSYSARVRTGAIALRATSSSATPPG